ncbi:MAG: FecR family protein [Burkholderiaceae bacterium]|jgi:hypothetical protein|nr:FecR family protein [Burkholderiaceae bacterium]
MIKSISRVVMAVLCVWQLCAAAAIAQQAQAVIRDDQRDGTIKTVQGEVDVVREGIRKAAVVGGPLHMTDRIQTGADGMAAVTLKDGTMLSLGPDTAIDLSAFQFNSTTQEGNILIDLLHGTMRMTTGLIAKIKPDRVKVVTPTTVIGVRGTDFIVEENR